MQLDNNVKIINIEDVLSHFDKTDLDSPQGVNFIRIEDAETGRVLLQRRENKVVLRGRVFSLEKLYNHNSNYLNYVNNLDREINLFKIGSGGTPMNDPYSPIAPDINDRDLTNPVPFRVVNATVPETALTLEEQTIYHLPVVEGNLTKYYGKRFETFFPEWVIDPAKNTVFRRLQLLINIRDARNSIINELALFFSTPDTFSDAEIYSRVTFPNEAIQDTKTLRIYYYTYA
jgi:hypothetical protein